MHPVVLGNEFNDREASGLHPSQRGGNSLPREQEPQPRGYHQEEKGEGESLVQIRWRREDEYKRGVFGCGLGGIYIADA